ncbi:hypothetical protein FXV83_16490 [Bradyrhizobium hipponense]|uniref:Uncharacterized protein n=1 Tax=Bradyrhizobium hipponense TaxID=2605638 RepID=A0A5S4YWW8_9BRAD|nr:hypothetical protein [Bradyrhizobium hipponense]TYO65529.1 hypothetical protein FXV83_16490 [Bradyrhizobium hipponense]
MTDNTNAATPEVVASEPAPAPVYYDVKLNARFTLQDFNYLPRDHHIVDKTVYDAMEAAGVVADVKQLS